MAPSAKPLRQAIYAACVLWYILPAAAHAQAVVVDHTTLAVFDQLASSGFQATAESTKMMFVDRSVGANINDGLTCLSTPYATALTSCKRNIHPVAAYSNSPETWSGTYSRANWSFFGWKGLGIPPEIVCNEGSGSVWQRYLNCFTDFVNRNQANYTVFGMLPSYLDADDAPSMLSVYTSLRAAYPSKKFIYFTSSLSRGSTQSFSSFNAAVRSHVQANGGFLVDVADIESHTQTGAACYDNRDGVEYVGPNGSENYPDDGVNTEAICQQYTSEVDGGHLGNPDVGKIRIAKGVWILMARIAGWNPGNPDSPPGAPANLRIIRD